MNLKLLLCTVTLAACSRALAGPMPVYSNTQFTGNVFAKKPKFEKKKKQPEKKPRTETKTSVEVKPVETKPATTK